MSFLKFLILFYFLAGISLILKDFSKASLSSADYVRRPSIGGILKALFIRQIMVLFKEPFLFLILILFSPLAANYFFSKDSSMLLKMFQLASIVFGFFILTLRIDQSKR